VDSFVSFVVMFAKKEKAASRLLSSRLDAALLTACPSAAQP